MPPRRAFAAVPLHTRAEHPHTSVKNRKIFRERTPIHGCGRCPSVNAGARRAVSATKRCHKKEGPSWGSRVLLVGVCRRPCSSPFHPRASARVVAWVLAPGLAARTRPNKTSGRAPLPCGEGGGPNELRSAAMRTPKSSTVLAPS